MNQITSQSDSVCPLVPNTISRTQFFKELRKTRKTFKWWVTENGSIRALEGVNNLVCPITAVCGSVTGHQPRISSTDMAESLIGLDRQFIKDIVYNADHADHTDSEPFRKKLLKALDLKEIEE